MLRKKWGSWDLKPPHSDSERVVQASFQPLGFARPPDFPVLLMFMPKNSLGKAFVNLDVCPPTPHVAGCGFSRRIPRKGIPRETSPSMSSGEMA